MGDCSTLMFHRSSSAISQIVPARIRGADAAAANAGVTDDLLLVDQLFGRSHRQRRVIPTQADGLRQSSLARSAIIFHAGRFDDPERPTQKFQREHSRCSTPHR